LDGRGVHGQGGPRDVAHAQDEVSGAIHVIIAAGSAFTAANLFDFDAHAGNPLGYGTGMYDAGTATTFTGKVTSLSEDVATLHVIDISVSN
jgi:hypothetical protein